MADYTYQELMRMQNDAIKRVEDMQRRARKTAGFSEERESPNPERRSSNQQNNGYGVQKEQPKRVQMPDDYLQDLKEYAKNISEKKYEDENEVDDIRSENGNDRRRENQEQKKRIPSAKKSTDGINGVLGDIKIDEDKALLLSLVLLLSEEKADETLILALLYMLS